MSSWMSVPSPGCALTRDRLVLVISDPAGRSPLDAARLASVDPDVLPGVRIEVVEEAASTNVLVAERARSGPPEGLVVVAEHHTAARGRVDRSWDTQALCAYYFSALS